ncbi:MAG: hypothetical protein LBO74_08990 [Candidatus Symbiothrix sp.]|jgi:RNAse (barnase) inhibitor barstar|nr:hypothetical protein [Candidatus Symbiothrix sp.]
MTTKNKLKTFFDTENESLKLIEKYEENIDFFNDLLRNGHKEDVEFVIPIKMYKYADHLQQEGYYTKALSVLDEVEKDLERIKGQSKWYKMYFESMIFHKGVCFGRLKKYKKSNKYFKFLLEQKSMDGKYNDRFVDWYKSNKKHQITDILEKIMVTACIIYVIIAVAKFFGYKMLFIGNVASLVLFLSAALFFGVGYIIDKQKIDFKNRENK